MWILDRFLGWHRKIRKLRKRWDREREKALKKRGLMRADALQRLDIMENNLRMMEERQMGRVERARLAKELEIGLAEVGEMLKMKEEEYSSLSKRKGL